MSTEDKSLKRAEKKADNCFWHVFFACLLLSFLGFADGLYTTLLDAMVRDELDWFSEIFYDLSGPRNLAAELREDHFLPFMIMAAITSFIVAFVVALIVFFFSASSENPEQR